MDFLLLLPPHPHPQYGSPFPSALPSHPRNMNWDYKSQVLLIINITILLKIVLLNYTLPLAWFHFKTSWDFPGSPVVKNPPFKARDSCSIPGWGTKIPHMWGN